MLKDFKEFALRGNVVDMAVGIIIGAAFGKIVSSMVSDILMPPLALLTGGISFADRFVVLGSGDFATIQDAVAANMPVLKYGIFIDQVVEFVIIAFAVFLMVRQINRLKGRTPPPPPPSTKPCPWCTSSIPLAAKRCPLCTSQLEGAQA